MRSRLCLSECQKYCWEHILGYFHLGGDAGLCEPPPPLLKPPFLAPEFLNLSPLAYPCNFLQRSELEGGLFRKGVVRFSHSKPREPREKFENRPLLKTIIRESETTIKIKFALFGGGGGERGKLSKGLHYLSHTTDLFVRNWLVILLCVLPSPQIEANSQKSNPLDVMDLIHKFISFMHLFDLEYCRDPNQNGSGKRLAGINFRKNY